ncbi:MAG TPA: hypothetical protein VGL81_18815 [Polyangiaceae bacterium]
MDELLVPLPAPRATLPTATHVRSTLVLSSHQSLRSRGLFERYAAGLDEAHRPAILEAVAGVWLPMDVGVAHYRACDALGLPSEEQARMGRDVNARVQGSVLGLVARTAREAGLTPWVVLGSLGRLWQRTFDGGGGVEVRKTGPKDARAELVGLPLLEIAYFRHAFRGVFEGGLQPISQRAYVREESDEGTPTSAVFRVQWV